MTLKNVVSVLAEAKYMIVTNTEGKLDYEWLKVDYLAAEAETRKAVLARINLEKKKNRVKHICWNATAGMIEIDVELL